MCKSLLGFDGEKKWASTLQTTRERNSIGVHIYIYIYAQSLGLQTLVQDIGKKEFLSSK